MNNNEIHFDSNVFKNIIGNYYLPVRFFNNERDYLQYMTDSDKEFLISKTGDNQFFRNGITVECDKDYKIKNINIDFNSKYLQLDALLQNPENYIKRFFGSLTPNEYNQNLKIQTALEQIKGKRSFFSYSYVFESFVAINWSNFGKTLNFKKCLLNCTASKIDCFLNNCKNFELDYDCFVDDLAAEQDFDDIIDSETDTVRILSEHNEDYGQILSNCLLSNQFDAIFDGSYLYKVRPNNTCVLLRYFGHEKKIRLPDCINEISHGVFANNCELEEIDLNNAEKIEECAFFKAKNLKKVIGKKVTRIHGSAFAFCYELKNLLLGSNKVEFDYYCFCHCFKLEKTEELENVPEEAFGDSFIFDYKFFTGKETIFAGCKDAKELNSAENASSNAKLIYKKEVILYYQLGREIGWYDTYTVTPISKIIDFSKTNEFIKYIANMDGFYDYIKGLPFYFASLNKLTYDDESSIHNFISDKQEEFLRDHGIENLDGCKIGKLDNLKDAVYHLGLISDLWYEHSNYRCLFFLKDNKFNIDADELELAFVSFLKSMQMLLLFYENVDKQKYDNLVKIEKRTKELYEKFKENPEDKQLKMEIAEFIDPDDEELDVTGPFGIEQYISKCLIKDYLSTNKLPTTIYDDDNINVAYHSIDLHIFYADAIPTLDNIWVEKVSCEFCGLDNEWLTGRVFKSFLTEFNSEDKFDNKEFSSTINENVVYTIKPLYPQPSDNK